MANIQPPPSVKDVANFDRWLRIFVAIPVDGADAETTTADHTLLQNLNSSSYTHLTSSQAQGLTSNADTVLHFHSSDRDRANHTGTQTSDTISDFASAVQASSTNNAGFYLAFAAAQG
jgi:predicted deacylase